MQMPKHTIIISTVLLLVLTTDQVHAWDATAPNGVPIMYIEQPNAAGLSHNRLDSFNVDPKGLIIDNSATGSYNSQSQLGGLIPASDKLQQSAKVILNEVIGSTPSQLRGPIEITGDKADLIVANPNGLVIDGARFINIGRMTLSTGRPTFNNNGGLQTLNVTGGDITIEGDGFDAKGGDSVDLYAQALQLNGKLYAHTLSLRLGSQSVDYPSGAANPNKAPNQHLMLLDSSKLGGMYADRVTLVGSGVGLGVRLPPEVVVTQDNIQINVEGEIHFPNSGERWKVDRAQRKAEREQRKADREQRKADREQRKADREQRKADREQRKAEREQRKAEREQRKKDREQRKAEREQRKKDREQRKADRAQTQGGQSTTEQRKAEREQRKAEREQRKADREQRKKDREQRKAEREQRKAEREQRKAEREQRKKDREQRKADRAQPLSALESEEKARVVPGSREATRDTRHAEGAKGDPKGASERGVQSYWETGV